MSVFVTGANGFVGRAVCAELRTRGTAVIAAMREPPPTDAHAVRMPDLGPESDWTPLLTGRDIDRVIHLAARVHVMNDRVEDPLAEFRRVNTAGTLRLARQAAAAGVRRFVYVSSIKVNGEQTLLGHPFVARVERAPSDPYGQSKFEAERGLAAIAHETGMEITVVRPPLVYGPGVRANFLSMMRWIKRGIPLPFGAIDNRRSLVALDNLVDLLIVCTEHPAAAGKTFLVSDGEDLSTTDLLRRIGQALGKPARLVPVPPAVLTFAATLAGRADIARRLCGSLQVDVKETRSVLGWQPVVDVDVALRKTAAAFLSGERV
jgi:UDP-4-keto-D-QuiNAc 4-reductase